MSFASKMIDIGFTEQVLVHGQQHRLWHLLSWLDPVHECGISEAARVLFPVPASSG